MTIPRTRRYPKRPFDTRCSTGGIIINPDKARQWDERGTGTTYATWIGQELARSLASYRKRWS